MQSVVIVKNNQTNYGLPWLDPGGDAIVMNSDHFQTAPAAFRRSEIPKVSLAAHEGVSPPFLSTS